MIGDRDYNQVFNVNDSFIFNGKYNELLPVI